MVVIESKGKEYQIKSKVSELTLGEFEYISGVFETMKSNVSKWMQIISKMSGIPLDEIEDWNSNKFQTLVNMLFEQDLSLDKITEVTINDIKYFATDNLSARDMTLLEKIFFDKDVNRISIVIASRFRQEGLSNKENYNTVRERAELFRELSIVGLIPYLTDGVIGFLEYLKAVSPINIEQNEVEGVS